MLHSSLLTVLSFPRPDTLLFSSLINVFLRAYLIDFGFYFILFFYRVTFSYSPLFAFILTDTCNVQLHPLRFTTRPCYLFLLAWLCYRQCEDTRRNFNNFRITASIKGQFFILKIFDFFDTGHYCDAIVTCLFFLLKNPIRCRVSSVSCLIYFTLDLVFKSSLNCASPLYNRPVFSWSSTWKCSQQFILLYFFERYILTDLIRTTLRSSKLRSNPFKKLSIVM